MYCALSLFSSDDYYKGNVICLFFIFSRLKNVSDTLIFVFFWLNFCINRITNLSFARIFHKENPCIQRVSFW